MLKISYAGCLGLSLAILSQFSVEMCFTAGIAKKITKTYLEGSRSFEVIDVDTNKKLVTIVCYDKQHVCAYMQPFSHYTR